MFDGLGAAAGYLAGFFDIVAGFRTVVGDEVDADGQFLDGGNVGRDDTAHLGSVVTDLLGTVLQLSNAVIDLLRLVAQLLHQLAQVCRSNGQATDGAGGVGLG